MNSPNDLADWMRERFPVFNKNIDDGIQSDFEVLINEIPAAINAAVLNSAIPDREKFTYISMIHSALFHHAKVVGEAGGPLPSRFEEVMGQVEQELVTRAKELGVEHRFLATFYLLCNPEIPDMLGKFAQFRAMDYETAFLRVNREGTIQYKIAAKALMRAFIELHGQSPNVRTLTSLLEQAAQSFFKISRGNNYLLQTPGGEEFRYLTQYFGEVRVAGGPPLRGVNAGDQPWPYIIDLVLGVNLKSVFETAFEGTPVERHYPDTVHDSADVVEYEFQSQQYLHANYLLPEDYDDMKSALDAIERWRGDVTDALSKITSHSDQLELANHLLTVIKNYVTASGVHYSLAKRYVPKGPNGEQIGSAGTNIRRYLHDGLNEERRKVQQRLISKYPQLSERKTTEEATA